MQFSTIGVLDHYYKISVFTGDVRGAGTDADVYVILYGTEGRSAELKLGNWKNNFGRNK